MTDPAPTPPELTADEAAALETLVTSQALAYHNSVVPADARVKPAQALAAYRLMGGGLADVAADILDVAANHARLAGLVGSSASRKIKLGPLEIQRAGAAGVNIYAVSAQTWEARAARLRRPAAGAVARPLAGARTGSTPGVFVAPVGPDGLPRSDGS